MKLKNVPTFASACLSHTVRHGRLATQALLSGVALALSAPVLSAATLYDDSFNYTADADLFGQTTATDAPGLANRQWFRATSGTTYDATIQPTGTVALGSDVGAALHFGSASGYSMDRYLSLSLDFRQGDLWNGVSETTAEGTGSWSFAGVSLGFWTAAGSGGVFSGVAVDRYGNIKISSGGTLLAKVDAASSLDANTLYTLSYVVDTESGSISSLVLSDGTNKIYEGTFLSVEAFKGSNLNLVGFRSRGNAAGQTSYVEAFSVSSIPEPSAAAGIMGAAALLVGLSRRGAR